MWLGLEASSKVVGLAGGAFTLAKTFFSWAVDQSRQRKISKITAQIGETIGLIRGLEEPKSHLEDINLQAYISQLESSLKADLNRLQRALDKKQAREKKLNEVPRGARTWLLLYWPEGFDGWLVHCLFYGSTTLLAVAGWAAVRDGKFSFSTDSLVSVVAYFAIPLYLRWTALRLKVVAILKRIGDLENINADLGLLQRTLLLFKPGNGWPLLIHIEYYVFVAGTLAVPILFQRAGGPGTLSKPFFWETSTILMTVFLLCARVLAADALTWRFLGTASTSETSQTTPSTASTS
jgi:hypothetical protein